MEESQRQGAVTPVVDIARYTLLSLALAVASLLLIPFYGFALAALPLPALLAATKHGPKAGIIVAVAAALPVAALAGPDLGISVLIVTLVLGAGQARLIRTGIRTSRMLLICVGVFVVLGVGGVALAFATKAVTVAELSRASLAVQLQIARYAGTSAKQAAKAAKEFRELYVYVLPGGIAALSMVCGLESFLLSQYALRRNELPSIPVPEFKNWQLPWYLAWGFLIGLAAAVGYGYLGAGQGRIALYLGLNLLVVFGTIYMFQGLAIVMWHCDRYKLPLPARTVIVALALLGQLFFLIPTWIGLFDTWFNYRKLPRET